MRNMERCLLYYTLEEIMRIERNVRAYTYEACFYQLVVNTVSLENLFVIMKKRQKIVHCTFNFGNNVVFALCVDERSL